MAPRHLKSHALVERYMFSSALLDLIRIGLASCSESDSSAAFGLFAPPHESLARLS